MKYLKKFESKEECTLSKLVLNDLDQMIDYR